MAGYLIRRLTTAILVVFGIILVTFLMLHIIAPSPAITVLGPKAQPAAIKAWNHANGFDKPWWDQFATYLGHLFQGNLGYSYHLNQSVTALLTEKAPLSGFLTVASLALSILVALPLGIYQGVKRNSFGDIAATSLAMIFYSMPTFLVALVLVQVFALSLKWVNPNVPQDQTLSGALAGWPDLIMPIVALTITAVASYSRYQRSAALDVLAQDYIKVARAKGLSERLVYSRHLVRNASLPMITLIGLSLPLLIAGNLLVEYTFNINGLGLLFVNALQGYDYNVLMAYTLITAVLTVVGNLIADICLTLSDPRIKLV
ncbi:ABC transporter permease [Streptacidiphilus melanogenes]|uniref:ABC transporter permease n=1 Tax=Streptacidiphilus melanogenes TaxID=411235 RepID=UPI0005A65046|nr:ABC transporter permease [Streptacidiphilus melanogenes]